MATPAATRALDQLSVSDAMTPGVLACPAQASVRAAAATMAARSVHAIVVWPQPGSDEAERPRLLTAADVTRAIVRGGPDEPSGTVASPAPIIEQTTDLAAAVRMMAEGGHAHLVALALAAPLPFGVLSSFDVAAVLAGRLARIAHLPRPAPARPQIGTSDLARVPVVAAMRRGLVACGPGAPLGEVAATMVDRRVHTVALLGEGGVARRLIRDMDVIRAAAAGELSVTAGDLAGEQPVEVGIHEQLDRAARLMVEHGTEHVVVVDDDKASIGVVSTLDVVEVASNSA
jgi:predicted transcriptional regulator